MGGATAPAAAVFGVPDLQGPLLVGGDRSLAVRHALMLLVSDLASQIGARPLQNQAETELRACGARPRSHSYTGVESLTPSERRVAELVAAGRSNRDVAQSLFVSRATIETHLRSVFRKLGVASRDQLAPLLSEQAPAPDPTTQSFPAAGRQVTS
jgi:DNA-binding CsgD family transcriptional regulator